MISARVLEHRIPVIAGRIKAAQLNLALLQAVLPTLSAPQDIAAANSAILSVTRTATNSGVLLSNMATQWEQVCGVILAGDVDTMVEAYRNEACGLIVIFDGILMTARPEDVEHLATAQNQILSDPETDNPTARVLTVLGFRELTMTQLQGLLAAAYPLEQAGCKAQGDVITQNQSVPFTDWNGIKALFDLKFGEYYDT